MVAFSRGLATARRLDEGHAAFIHWAPLVRPTPGQAPPGLTAAPTGNPIFVFHIVESAVLW